MFLQFSGGQEAASFVGVMAEEGWMWREEVGKKNRKNRKRDEKSSAQKIKLMQHKVVFCC